MEMDLSPTFIAQFEDGREIFSKKSKVRKTIPRINESKNPKLR
tara:strand:- start:213 stop:341 length:129 start_codon:yes stop_codon:yes gene_type:complete